MSSFNEASSTGDVIAGVSLVGKTALVTGASAGLGVETARALGSAGARVVMIGRDEPKLAAAAEGVRAAEPEASIETALLDLADLGSVRAGAERLMADYPQVQLLINNAGIMACPESRTAQGFEMQFGTNHLGHFLLTCLLAPTLVAGAPARIVNLSSAGHRASDILWDDPNYENTPYDPWQAYGQAKTANILFSVALDARLKDRGVRAFAVHPGAIETELGRHLDDATRMALLKSNPRVAQMRYKTVPQGSATSVWAASSPELEGQGGLYLEDCGIAGPTVGDAIGGVESYALDAESAERLWSLSEDLVGERFAL